MRCFISLELNDLVKKELLKEITELKKTGIKASYPKGEQLHLTLLFLGEISEGEVQEVKETLSQIKFNKFHFQVKGLGFFPNDSLIRVCWSGVQEGREEVIKLQSLISTSLNKEGEDFRPHVTLARVKSGANLDFLRRLKKGNEGKAFGECPAEKVCLKQSIPSENGIEHKELFCLSLL